MGQQVTNSNLTMYADDHQMYKTGSNLAMVKDSLEEQGKQAMSCNHISELCKKESRKVGFGVSAKGRIDEKLNKQECEVLWAIINSRRLPRGCAKLVIGVLYHPPGANKSLMLEHLQSSLEHLTRHFHLKQIVDFPTRGSMAKPVSYNNNEDRHKNRKSVKILHACS
ncbi:Hypothetical predicted protein, partial [Paramuricea clavata]